MSESIYKTCYDYLTASAIEHVNTAVLLSLDDGDVYDNIITIEKNNEGEIVLISANNQKVNALSQKIIKLTNFELSSTLKKGVPVPWPSFFGLGYFSGFGKTVNLKTVNVASVNCEFYSDFRGEGINQTIHSIYATVTTTINLEIPLNNKSVVSTSKVLISENVLLGKVPDFYYGKNIL